MKITATFSNGKTVNLITKRAITHAYLVKNQWQTFTGFSGSESLAKRASASDSKYGKVEHLEIVKVVVVEA